MSNERDSESRSQIGEQPTITFWGGLPRIYPPQEDEATRFKRENPSSDPDNPMYIPPGRRLVNNGVISRPFPEVNMLLTELFYVNVAVERGCFAGGTHYTVPPNNGRATNSLWIPLDCVRSHLHNLSNQVTEWSKRIVMMGLEERKFGM